MGLRNYQRAFNGGLVSPSMFARIDDGKYQTGLAVCDNFIIEPQGPVRNRTGFAYVNDCKALGKVRLIPFTFSVTQTMVIELGHHYARFHTLGATLMNGDVPYEIETPYDEKDVMDIHYVQSADVLTFVHPAYAPMELRRHGALDWRLVQIRFVSDLPAPTNVRAEQTIDKKVSNPTAYIREYAVTALKANGKDESARSQSVKINCNPYGDGAYNTITWDGVVGAGLYRVYRNQGGLWAFIGQTSGTSIIDENKDPDGSITPPLQDDVFMVAKGITKVNVVNGGSGYVKSRTWMRDTLAHAKFTWIGDSSTDYPPESAFQAKLIDRAGKGSGAQFELRTSTSSYIDDGCDGGEGNCWRNYFCSISINQIVITNQGEGYEDPCLRVRVTHNTLGGEHPSTSNSWKDLDIKLDHIGTTIEVSDATGVGADIEPIIVDGSITGATIRTGGINYSAPTLTVKGELGSGAQLTAEIANAGDFPGAVSYFEQRRWFAGTSQRPSHLWATRSGTESDMSFSLPSQDDDRIAVRVAAREANRILHIVPLSQLMLFTGASEWRVSPLNSDAVTPSSMSVRPQSYVGASNVQPLVIGSSVVYGAARGGHLRELGYSYESGGYITGDICLRAPHLFDNRDIVDLVYSKAPIPIVWAVSSDGSLIAMTYVPEQQVGAFSRIKTEGSIESICVVAEGAEDVLYAVVRRVLNGRQHCAIERLCEMGKNGAAYLDCYGEYNGEPKTEIGGLHWLEGERVSIVADGSVEPEQVVTGGKITLAVPAKHIIVGLPYVSDLKTLPVALALQDGSYGSGHRKNVIGVTFRLVDSTGLSAGPSFDEEDLTEYPARGIELAGSVPDPITGEICMAIAPSWDDSGSVCVRQVQPLPVRIVSMTVDVEMA